MGGAYLTREGEKKFELYVPFNTLFFGSNLQEMILNEDHPLALNLSFSVSLGLMPVTLSVKTTGCGIRKSEFTADETGEMEIDSKGFSYLTNKASCTVSIN